jgi:PAS fold
MASRMATEFPSTLVEVIEHVPEALVVWGADDSLLACNRRYAELFPEPSFVRPGVRFRHLVELNIDTRDAGVSARDTGVSGEAVAP